MPNTLTPEDEAYFKAQGIDTSNLSYADEQKEPTPETSNKQSILQSILATGQARIGGYLGGGAGLAAFGLASSSTTNDSQVLNLDISTAIGSISAPKIPLARSD